MQINDDLGAQARAAAAGDVDRGVVERKPSLGVAVSAAGRSSFSTIPTALVSGRFLNVFGHEAWNVNSAAGVIDRNAFPRLLSRESYVTEEHPKAAWFRGQALECIVSAQRAKDARVKRLHTLEAERWLRLAELKPHPTESYTGPSPPNKPVSLP
jgi:hypothetical protein